MKKGIFSSYVTGLLDRQNGESFGAIIAYFFPEVITSFVLYSLPQLIDIYLIGHLQSMPNYVTLSTTNNVLHFLVKIAEAFSVGTIILAGQFNGMGAYQDVGRSVRDAFWVTFFLGVFFSLSLFYGAASIYAWYGVDPSLIPLGVPFLRLRSIGVFFMFMYFAMVGFLRGIKNTHVPMYIFVLGALVFMITDYTLIYGMFGFPRMGIQGSAWASVLQYGTMFTASFCWVFCNKATRMYSIKLFSVWSDISYIKHFFKMSWPVILDKATVAAAYIWLGKMIAPMGIFAQASFSAIKDIERLAFLPAIAFAQIITFLVSNDYKVSNWDGIKANIKRVLFLASLAVFILLAIFFLNLDSVLKFFDRSQEFTPFVAKVFPLLSVLVFFDLLQLLLSGALRGAGNVTTVMMVRLLICVCYFGPVSYLITRLPVADQTVKFVLVYGSFYIGNALMSIFYIRRFRGDEWKQSSR